MTPWISALLVFVGVAAGSVALFILLEDLRGWSSRRRVQQRVTELVDGDESSSEQRPGLFREARDGAPGVLESVAARIPQLADLPRLLENAGLSWSARNFLLLTLGAALAGLLAGLLLDRGLLFALLLALVAAAVPYMVVARKRTRRLQRFEELFPEAVDMLGRAIRAGHPVSAGMQMVGQEIPDPVGAEFRRMFEELRFGSPFHDVLMGLVDRIDLVDVRIFTTALLVQREVGGNLAEILDNISAMVRSRFKIQRQLRTYTAQGRMTGMAVGALPIVAGLLFYALNPDYMRILFEHPMGRMMLGAAITLQIFGYLWIRKIVAIEI